MRVSWDFSIQSRSLSLFHAYYTYSLNVRVHGRIGLNASLFSRERRRTLASWPSWRAFIPSCFYLPALLFSPTWHFSLCRHRTFRNVSRVATVAPFYSGRRKMRAREDEGIIIYIAVKPEFYWALSSRLNVNQLYDVQVVTHLSFHVASLLLFEETGNARLSRK